MELVIDTNVLFAFFKKGSKVEKLVRELRRQGVILLSPEFVLSELEFLKPQISKYAGISDDEIKELFKLLRRAVKSVPVTEYLQFSEEAKKISPHERDSPLFALSLKFKCPIWSREPRLKRQKFVKVLDDKGVERLLKELS